MTRRRPAVGPAASTPEQTTPEDRATALVNRIVDEHEWTACGLEMCATLKRELIAAVAGVCRSAYPWLRHQIARIG